MLWERNHFLCWEFHLNVKTWWSAGIRSALSRKITLSRPLVAVDGRTSQFKSAHLLVSKRKGITQYLYSSYIVIAVVTPTLLPISQTIFLHHSFYVSMDPEVLMKYFCFNDWVWQSKYSITFVKFIQMAAHSIASFLDSFGLWIDLLCHHWKNATWLWVRGEETRAFFCSQNEKALFWVQKELLEDNDFHSAS